MTIEDEELCNALIHATGYMGAGTTRDSVDAAVARIRGLRAALEAAPADSIVASDTYGFWFHGPRAEALGK